MSDALAVRREDFRPAVLPTVSVEGFAARVGSLAIRALYREVELSPKPGLVSPADSGSHTDMDFRTFVRSLQSLRDYFPEIARVGAAGPSFEPLRQLGVAAEAKMLQATGGINTHRGAIFNIGLLCAAAGALHAEGRDFAATDVCVEVTRRWGAAILGSASPASHSHGAEVARRYGSGGARREAADGFPAALEVGLPAYRDALRLTGDPQRAALQCLFALIARLEDTNLLWRGGPEGLAFAQWRALDFLAAGGVAADGWEARAQHIHREFVARNLSPGGSADLLGVTLFLDAL
ncbi:MAG: triphosphoribosyl-dephospho-CoA synthase MdcB [Proteobacteria bacterium]|nr:triphosphoribosyl-dephospho-CoA synthase MdcB [Pseudomonadota bacterium]